MNYSEAYIRGFVKRAADHGLDVRAALAVLYKSASDHRTNQEINAEINTNNANPNRSAGNMSVVDFPVKNQNTVRKPAYTPTNPGVKFPMAAALSNTPIAGNIVGPLGRFATGDFTGGLINAASTAALPLPGGIVLSKGLELLNDARDFKQHVDRNAMANNAFEQRNSTVQD
jgi:hypothetical protein